MLVLLLFKQKTAYEMRISDWSSDVCSSDLTHDTRHTPGQHEQTTVAFTVARTVCACARACYGRRSRQRTKPVTERAMMGLRQPAQVGVSKIGRASRRERVCKYVEI